MIELKHLSKSYGKNKVLKDININFYDDNLYIIKGVSGCGKTTLLKIISGIITDYDGECIINGKDIKKMSSNEVHSVIGYMCQESLLLGNLTIRDNLLFIKDDIDKINYYAHLFNVEKLLDKYPRQISGGERQRIALIRTLLNDSPIILLDEPTSSLDVKNSKKFMECLHKIDNKIIILVTHKNLFDDDGEVIKLNYGAIEQKTKEHKDNKISNNSYAKKSFNFKYLTKYAMTRSKQGKFTFVLITLFLIIILAAISLKLNYTREYVNSNKRHYPYMFISVSDYGRSVAPQVNDIVNSDDFIAYDNYIYSDNNYTIYPIYDYDAVNFNVDGVLECGRTPKNNNEVLVDHGYVEDVLNKTNEEALNTNITINNKDYVIVGIVTDEEVVPWQYAWNFLYHDIEKDVVFMMYDELKEFGTTIIPKLKMYKYVGKEDIFNHDSIYYKNFIQDPESSYYLLDNKITNLTDAANIFAEILLLIILVIGVIILVFIANQMRLNLFYRKKELGYLQIFGIRKSQLLYVLYFEYLYDILKEIVLSIILYYIGIVVIKLITGYNFLISFKYVVLFAICVVIYVIIALIVPITLYLRKSISKLIA